jgi:hypothetical protein
MALFGEPSAAAVAEDEVVAERLSRNLDGISTRHALTSHLNYAKTKTNLCLLHLSCVLVGMEGRSNKPTTSREPRLGQRRQAARRRVSTEVRATTPLWR